MFEELGRQAGKLGKQLGDLKDILSTDHWSASPSHKEKGTESRQRNVISPKSLLEHDESKEAILQGLDAQYYQGDFDSLLHELQQLPVTVDETALEAVCEARTSVLEVVSELLSVHVLQHYDKFVEGINQISTIEEELQQAHIVTKTARSDLAMTLHDVQCNIRVAHQTRRKQAYISLLDVLLKLQQANNLHIALKEAQESGEYAQAFWLCAQCCQSMETLQELRVAEQTNITINRLYEETTQRLENALQAVCTEFRPDQFCKVLEGYMFLGNTSHLGGEVTTCFTNVVNTSGLQVVRGIILTRPGFEERAKSTTNLQELVKWLPSDLFRTALARVLMVIFDIMLSHYTMMRWHESALDQHTQDLAQLHNNKMHMRAKLAQQIDTPPGALAALPANPSAANPDLIGAYHPNTDASMPQASRPRPGLSPLSTSSPSASASAWVAGAADGGTDQSTLGTAAAAESGAPGSLLVGINIQLTASACSPVAVGLSTLQTPQNPKPAQPTPVSVSFSTPESAPRGFADSPSSLDSSRSPRTPHRHFHMHHFHPANHQHEIHINTAVEHLQEIELLEQEEVEWGEVLKIVQNGLVNGRRFLWDEAARKIGILLSSPAAFEGEHFLQVSEWVQRILCAGEAFSGLECTTLRNMLATQSGNFFRSFHASNLEALNSMLEKELWRRLPTMEGLPSIATALRQPTYSESLPVADVSSKDPKLFAHWASAGNPWRIRRRRSPAGKRPGGVFRLGFAGSTVLDEDRASKRLEVDEHGLPRRVTNDIWSNGTSRRTTAESDVGTIGAGSIFSEDEAEELYADYIDEDSQRARQAGSPGGVGVDTAAMTNSSMKMMKWMRDYGELMRILRPAPFVYAGLCELFELYMLHTFHTFSEVSLADLANEQAPQATSSEAVSTRLRNTLLRIMSQSLVKYKNITLPGQRVTSAWQNLINSQATVQPSGDSSMFQRLKEKKVDLSRTSMSQAALQPATAPPVAAVAGAEATTISNSGNLWGLQERTVAVESLMAVAHELKRAKHDLQSLLTAADYQSLEHFFSRTVEAAQDLEDCILRTGARFNLPIKSIVDRIAGQNFNLSAPPAKQSAWVDELCLHLTLFRDRMAQVKSLSAHNVQQLWRHAIAFTAEVILDGIAKVRSRCSAIGRNQMAADLQEITFALRSLAPQQPELAVCIDVNIRLVDNYIKAFFIPSIPDLEHWVQTHPEYSREQLVLLATAMAEFMGMKKKDKAEFLAQIQEIIM